MTTAMGLPPAVEALAGALGLTHLGALDPSFFSDPLGRVRRVLSNPDQRASLLAALDDVMPPGDDTRTTRDGQTVTRHPVVAAELGVVSLSITRSGSLSNPDVLVGLYARAVHDDPAITVEIDLPLVLAVGTELSVAAGTPAHPLAVQLAVPLLWERPGHVIGLTAVSLSVLVVAPPDLQRSRVAVHLTGLDLGIGDATDLSLDPEDLGADFSHALVMLVVAGLQQSPDSTDDVVALLIAQLPSVLGLDGRLPPLPLGDLISNPEAFRGWLTKLVSEQVNGIPALLTWLDSIAQILGLPASPLADPHRAANLPSGAAAAPLAALPTVASPVILVLADGGVSGPTIEVRVWLESAAPGEQALFVDLEVHVGGPDALLVGRAELLVIPLAGVRPVRALASAELLVESTAPLLPAAGPLTVGVARGGLRWDGTGVHPILELDQVHVDLPGVVEHPTDFARLDLSHARTLAAEARQAVGDFITAALGTAATSNALMSLLGFSFPPTEAELGAFANDPLRAIGQFHRTALTAGTYTPIAQAITELFGGTAAITGTGTVSDPWTAALDEIPVPVGSQLAIVLHVWNEPSPAGHHLHVGLGLHTPPAQAAPDWALGVLVDVVSFELPDTGPVHLGALGSTRLALDMLLPDLGAAGTSADRLHLAVGWLPGAPLQVEARLEGLSVAVDGAAVDLGTVSLPEALTEASLDTGWPAVRALLGRAASSWGGPVGQIMAALLGLDTQAAELPPGWPLLELPSGHLRDLLADPMELLRARLVGLVGGTDLEGRPLVESALDQVRDVLCGVAPGRLGLPALPSAPPVAGTGAYADPWKIPLTDTETPLVAEPIELIVWLEPGPPTGAAALVTESLGTELPDPVVAISQLRGLLPEIAAGLTGTDPESATRWLTTAAEYLDGTDGLTTTEVAGVLPTGVQLADAVVIAAHHTAPKSEAAVAATLAHLTTNDADNIPVLLVGPSFAPADVWSGLLAGVAVEQQVHIDLRVPGIDAAVADLATVRKGTHYVVDLADDGTETLDKIVDRLDRVVRRVCSLTGAPKIALVGHSTAGIAAVAYAAAHADLCQACVTIAAPYSSRAAALFAGGDEASGLRLVRALLPDGLPLAPVLGEAVAHLADALSGYVGVTPTPYPVSAFARTLPPTVDVTAVPTLAITAALDLPLLVGLSATVQEACTAATAATPTHLAWGLRSDVGLGDATSPAVTAHARLDLGRVPLVAADAAAEPAHPAHRLVIDALVSEPQGWLVGSAGTGGPLDVRLRAAGLQVVVTSGTTELTTTLYDGAVNGSGVPTMNLDDPRAARLMDAFVDRIAKAPSGSAARALADVLTALEIMSRDEATGISSARADAINALRTDARGWLAPRLATSLAARPFLFGFVPDVVESGHARQWRRPLGSLPAELVVSQDPWSLGVRTTGKGLLLGDTAGLVLSASLPLGGTPSTDVLLSIGDLQLSCRSGTVLVSAPPLLSDLQLFPADPAVAARLVEAARTAGFAAAVSAVLSDLLGGVPEVGSIVGLLTEPGRWLAGPHRFGGLTGGLDSAAVTSFLSVVGEALNLPPDATGLPLGGGLHLTAQPDEADGMRLAITAEHLALTPSGPTMDLDLALIMTPVPTGWVVTPAAAAALTVPLGGGSWPSLTIGAVLSDSGVALSIAPEGQAPIELLPHFAGLWDLLGGGLKALLPGVLDRLIADLAPAGPVLTHALEVADVLGLRTGNPPTFDSQALAGLVTRMVSGDLVLPPATVVDLLTAVLPPGAPVTISAANTTTEVAIDALPVPGAVHLRADFAGAPHPPTFAVLVHDLQVGAVRLQFDLQETDGKLAFDAGIEVVVEADVGFAFQPTLHVSGAPLALTVQPLGSASQFEFQLAPTPRIVPDRLALGELLVAWAEPVAAAAALDAARAHGLLTQALWTPPAGAPLTPLSLLRAASLVTGTDADLRVPPVLPDAPTILRGLVAGLDAFRLPISPELGLGVYAEGPTWVGLGLTGQINIDAGEFVVTAIFGSPEIVSWTTPAPGLGVLLLDDAAGISVRPGLRLGGLGVEVAKKAGRLVDTAAVRIGNIRALVQSAVDLHDGAITVTTLHGGLELTDIGLPLGGSSNMTNPIANSLLRPTGASGDDQPASPPASLQVYSNDSGQLTVQINGKAADQPIFVEIHKTFGPLHIDRVGLHHKMMGGSGDGIGALVDGGVDIAGLSVDVQGLELAIPLKHPAELDQWTVDLAGLALSFSAGPVKIAGGLLKTDGPGGVEYDGQLTVEVASFGLTALGSYAQAKEGDESYTSLFVFVVVDAPLGGPPFLFVTGLAGGVGYNRQLIVPSDPALIPNYPLIQAMGGGAGGPDSSPMATLRRMSAAMPARRGSYWVAAGVKFTTFELLNTKALAYVALDRGFEVGLMGVMTMALPTPATALVSIELALAAKYSSAEQLLAIRAQLTNNSWLISKDCQLTGGFAFYSWFGQRPQVLLTIGGMGPNWFVEPGDPHQYPVVPPVGFHWSVLGAVVVKGETYFALTPRQLAFGGALEVTGDFGPIRVWFAAWLNVDIQWDPLKYHADFGISIGASFHFTIDLLFTSITISVTISLGGSIVVEGPPLHGSVTVDLEIASVTVDFGTFAPPPTLDWGQFAAKFLALNAGPNGNETSSGEGTSVATVSFGQSADSAKQAPSSEQLPDGTFLKPWPVLPEFGLEVASKVPLNRTDLAGRGSAPGGTDPRPPHLQSGTFSIQPMGSSAPPFTAHLEVHVRVQQAGGTWADMDVSTVTLAPTYGHFPVAVWLVGGDKPPPEHPDMWLAASGAKLGFPVSVREATGALGEASSIPVSMLVEESSVIRPLPFAAPSVSPVAAAGASSPVSSRVRTCRIEPLPRPAAPRPVGRARCLVVLPPTGSAASVTHRQGVAAYQALGVLRAEPVASPAGERDASAHRAVVGDPEPSYARIEAGAVHVWQAPRLAGEFRGRGSGGVRVVTLTPTGYPLEDRVGVADDLRFDLHPHADRVVITSTEGDAERGPSVVGGWQLGTQLTQVGPDTALGDGCTLLLPIQAAPPTPRMAQRRIAARDLLRGQPGVQTVFPPHVDAVILLLDARDAAAASDLIVTTGQGHVGQGVLGEPLESSRDGRRCLILPVLEQPLGDRLDVTVASVRGWQIAGVVGVTGDPESWSGQLVENPHLDLVHLRTPSDGVDYVIAERQEGPA